MHTFRFCLLSIPVLFPFALPCFTPAAVRQVLTFRFHSGVLHDFRFLSSASVLGFWLLSLCFFLFLFSTVFALQPGSSGFSVPLSLSCSSSSFRSGFPYLQSDSKYSAFLFVSFRPSLLRSHSCSTGASLLNFFSGIGA